MEMTVQEAANFAGRGVAAIYAAIRQGRLPAQAKYGVLLVSQADLEKYKPTKRGRKQLMPRRLRTDISQSQLAREMGISRQRVNQIMNAEAHRARCLVYYAVKNGHLSKPQRCEQCGEEKRLEAHHQDYLKPLLVNWLCVTCHGLQHPRLRKEKSNGYKLADPMLPEITDAIRDYYRTLGKKGGRPRKYTK